MPWLGCVFNPQPTMDETSDRCVWDRRYVAGLIPQAELAHELWAECRLDGIERADVAVVLTDGGAGLDPPTDCRRSRRTHADEGANADCCSIIGEAPQSG